MPFVECVGIQVPNGSIQIPPGPSLKRARGHLTIERQVELVLLGDVEAQQGVQRVERPSQVHEVLRPRPIARKVREQALEDAGQVKIS